MKLLLSWKKNKKKTKQKKTKKKNKSTIIFALRPQQYFPVVHEHKWYFNWFLYGALVQVLYYNTMHTTKNKAQFGTFILASYKLLYYITSATPYLVVHRIPVGRFSE